MNKGRILIVDDEVDLLDVLKRYLTMMGYEVSVCDNAEAGVAKAKRRAFDVILMDIRMPKKNGVTAIEEIGTFDHNAHFIIITGYAIDAETAAIFGKERRICGPLQKPFDLSELTTRIEDILHEMGRGKGGKRGGT